MRLRWFPSSLRNRSDTAAESTGCSTSFGNGFVGPLAAPNRSAAEAALRRRLVLWPGARTAKRLPVLGPPAGRGVGQDSDNVNVGLLGENPASLMRHARVFPNLAARTTPPLCSSRTVVSVFRSEFKVQSAECIRHTILHQLASRPGTRVEAALLAVHQQEPKPLALEHLGLRRLCLTGSPKALRPLSKFCDLLLLLRGRRPMRSCFCLCYLRCFQRFAGFCTG
eukprot:scaffold36481_cov69-Phaeocystis_antarctica.AAC.2